LTSYSRIQTDYFKESAGMLGHIGLFFFVKWVPDCDLSEEWVAQSEQVKVCDTGILFHLMC